MSEIEKLNLGVYDWLYRSRPFLGLVDFFANGSWKQRDKTFCHDTVSLDHTGPYVIIITYVILSIYWVYIEYMVQFVPLILSIALKP